MLYNASLGVERVRRFTEGSVMEIFCALQGMLKVTPKSPRKC
jgi:hypothetical protein